MATVKIIESAGHGKNVAGNKKTSTIQVQHHPDGVDYYLLKAQIRFTVGDPMSKAKAYSRANAIKAGILAETVKGFFAFNGNLIYYTDGKNVYRATEGTVADVRTGYLIGRYECSVAHWQRYCVSVYTMEPIPAKLLENTACAQS